MTPLFLATAIPELIPASMHGIVPAGILTLVDTAVRALLVACIVGAGLRVMAGSHVPAQKTAWGLVLGGALLMPFLVSWAGNAAWVPARATWVIPTDALSQYVGSRKMATVLEEHGAQAGPAACPASAVPHHSAQPPSAPLSRSDAPFTASAAPDRFPAPSISSNEFAGADLSARPSAPGWSLPLSDLVWIVYGSVCLALLLRLAYGMGGAIGLWQSAEPVEIDSDLAGGLPLRSSGKIASPVTVGSGVVLPADYDEWGAEKLRIVLAHERAHVRQGDFYLQTLAGLYAAIFWFS